MCVYSAEAELHWSTVSASTTSEAYALLCVTVKLMGDKLLRVLLHRCTVKRLNYQWWWFYIRWLERQVSDLRSGFTVSQWTGGRSLSQKPLCSYLGCVSVHYLKIDTCTTKLLTVCKPLSSVVTVEAYSKETRQFIGATCRICLDFLFLHNVVQFSGQLKNHRSVCLPAGHHSQPLDHKVIALVV